MFGRWKTSKQKRHSGAPGWRAYVVGDVHGRLDLLDGLLGQIVTDHWARGADTKALLVFVGDMIDRGPDSAGVIERAINGCPSGFRLVSLAGNHEEVLLRLVDGREPGLLAEWLRFGGDECLRSYGLVPDQLLALEERDAVDVISESLPAAHMNFIRDMGDTFRFGDYLFVHAGVRPGIPLTQQSGRDLRWIREPFLSDPRDHGFMVVHGHTIARAVDERSNRIGIDTGAYVHGTLTALAIEGDERWVVQQQHQGTTVP